MGAAPAAEPVTGVGSMGTASASLTAGTGDACEPDGTGRSIVAGGGGTGVVLATGGVVRATGVVVGAGPGRVAGVAGFTADGGAEDATAVRGAARPGASTMISSVPLLVFTTKLWPSRIRATTRRSDPW